MPENDRERFNKILEELAIRDSNFGKSYIKTKYAKQEFKPGSVTSFENGWFISNMGGKLNLSQYQTTITDKDGVTITWQTRCDEGNSKVSIIFQGLGSRENLFFKTDIIDGPLNPKYDYISVSKSMENFFRNHEDSSKAMIGMIVGCGLEKYKRIHIKSCSWGNYHALEFLRKLSQDTEVEWEIDKVANESLVGSGTKTFLADLKESIKTLSDDLNLNIVEKSSGEDSWLHPESDMQRLREILKNYKSRSNQKITSSPSNLESGKPESDPKDHLQGQSPISIKSDSELFIKIYKERLRYIFKEAIITQSGLYLQVATPIPKDKIAEEDFDFLQKFLETAEGKALDPDLLKLLKEYLDKIPSTTPEASGLASPVMKVSI